MTTTHNTPCQGGCGKMRSILHLDDPLDWLCNECREREDWIAEEMSCALDAGCFTDRNDPELRAYAERGWERDRAEQDGEDNMERARR